MAMHYGDDSRLLPRSSIDRQLLNTFCEHFSLMLAKELHNHMKKAGNWVDWEHTVDKYLSGDPELEVSGIAVSWMPTFDNLKEAFDKGCNLFVTHEPLYSVKLDDSGKVVGGSVHVDPQLRRFKEMVFDENDAWVRKQEWLDKTGIAVYRCHDFWDDFPDIGVCGAWAKWLGFNDQPITRMEHYEVHEVGNRVLEDLARDILDRVKLLGQEAVQVVGDLNRKISKIAIGTGAITNYRKMYDLGADALLVTDDGTRLVESGQWSLDSDIPLLIVSHSTSEEPGMRTLASYIQSHFPDVEVMIIPVGCVYKTIK